VKAPLKELYVDNPIVWMGHCQQHADSALPHRLCSRSVIWKTKSEEDIRGDEYQLLAPHGRIRIRLVLHPDQYVVLSSIRLQVVQSKNQRHARTFDFIVAASPWALMNIHGGNPNAEQPIRVITELPRESVPTFENDEYAYNMPRS